ncbi:MAG: pentapeptide repeat-containing protein [Desertifilum sp.]|nr:pentapeptide repeat-containing protein [Desertifilum sp.]
MMSFNPQDFSNRDLRDRSFRGLDLSGADFSGSDLRGCDFSAAILVGTNFSRVQTGQSRTPARLLIARAGAGAIAVTLAGAIAGVEAVVATGVVATAIARGQTGILAAAIAGASAVTGCRGLLALFHGDFVQGSALSLGGAIAFSFAALLFLEALKTTEASGRTCFANADLTQAIFDEATVQDTDFSGATLNQVSYRGTQITSTRLRFHPFPLLREQFFQHARKIRLESSAHPSNRTISLQASPSQKELAEPD